MLDQTTTQTGETVDAAALHASAIVFDGSTVAELSTAHLDRARRGGVTAINHTVTVPYATTEQALVEINECRRWIDDNSDRAVLALTTADIRRAKTEGKEAIVFGPQDTEMIGGNLDLLGTFYDLGVRMLQLTYQRQNLVGAGCGEIVDTGLSHYGRKFVGAMDDLGIIVDVSHCGEKTGLDAMDASSNPVVVTHSFSHTLSPHIRAKSDDFIRALADNGGVIGVTSLSGFLYYPENARKRPDLRRFVEHVSHIVEIAGIDSVAIATDYEETLTQEARDASPLTPLLGEWAWEDRRAIGMDDAGDFPNFTTALLEGGFSEVEVRKILGENWLRTMAAVCD